jgi:hypothetical protein
MIESGNDHRGGRLLCRLDPGFLYMGGACTLFVSRAKFSFGNLESFSIQSMSWATVPQTTVDVGRTLRMLAKCMNSTDQHNFRQAWGCFASKGKPNHQLLIGEAFVYC